MTRILAFVDESPCAANVRAAAGWLGRLLGADVDPVHAIERLADHRGMEPSHGVRIVGGPTEDALLRELAATDVIAGVLGSRAVSPKTPVLGHIAQTLLHHATVPLVVAPPDMRPPPDHTPTIMVPLDAAEESAATLIPVANLLADAGAESIIVHVFDAASLPAFIGRHEDLRILAREFAHRRLPEISPRCELRLGDPGRTVTDLANENGADAVLVAWRQDLTPGRAAVMRSLLRDARVPLIAIPVTS